MMGQGCGRAISLLASRGPEARRRFLASRWLSVSALLLTLSGCAGDKDQTGRRVRALEDKLMRLQNETDQLREQVVRLEQHGRENRAAGEAADTADGSTLERPRLKLIRLQPQADQSSPANPPRDSSQAEAAPTADPAGHPPGAELRPAQAEPDHFNADDVDAESDAASRPVIKVRGGDVLSAADSESGETH